MSDSMGKAGLAVNNDVPEKVAAEKTIVEKAVAALPVSSFLALTLFVFGPAQLYYTNILEFNSSFLALFLYFILPTLLCILLTVTALALLKPPAVHRATSALFALAALLWFQGNMFVRDYGQLDGKDIEWSAHSTYGCIGAVIWIVFLIVSVAAPARISKIAPRLSMIGISIQLVSSVFGAAIAPDASYLHKEPITNKDAIFEFSSEKNVVILVLDSFQGDVFQGILNEEPRYGDIFDGFTYYRNSVSGFSHTPGNVLLILTGKQYDNQVGFREFLTAAFSPNSVPKILKEEGYQVDLLCTSGFGIEKILHADKSIATSLVGVKDVLGQNVKLQEAAFLFDLTLFRYLPDALKKHVYNEQAWLFSSMASGGFFGGFPAGPHRDDVEFMKAMASRAQATSERSAFKYIHLWLPHPPARINEKLEYSLLKATREDFGRQAKGTLELVKMFFARLKELGIYEDAMILVLSDHGFGAEVKEEVYGEGNVAESALPDALKGRGLSLFLVKPFMSTGELKVSDAPVSLTDVAKTVVSELGLETEIPGTSVFDIKESDTRERRYLFHNWETAGWSWVYLPPMEEYIITGVSWRDDSWSPTNKLYEEGRIEDISPQ